MSSEATIEIGGEIKSAWAYRLIYLSEKVEFETFYCPYCEIPLFSRNINTEEAIVRPPHFYFRGIKHIGDCNGEGLYAENPLKQHVKNKTLSRDMSYPDEFVPRPPQRERKPTDKPATSLQQSITPEEIRKRRLSAGKSGRPKATSYLLRAFVEAKNIVIKQAYDVFSAKSQNEERKKAIKDALLAMPLKLDDSTNYQYGFQSLAYPNRNRRIYHGNAKVAFNDSSFVLKGLSYQASTSDGTTKEIAFSIFIPLNILVDGAPRYHREILHLLRECLDADREIKFHCFGMAKQINNTEVEMPITSLDFIYLVPNHFKG